MLLALPVQYRKYEGDDGGANPEIAYVREVVNLNRLAGGIDFLDDIAVQKETGYDVLDSGGGV